MGPLNVVISGSAGRTVLPLYVARPLDCLANLDIRAEELSAEPYMRA